MIVCEENVRGSDVIECYEMLYIIFISATYYKLIWERFQSQYFLIVFMNAMKMLILLFVIFFENYVNLKFKIFDSTICLLDLFGFI